MHDYTVEIIAKGNTDTEILDNFWTIYNIDQYSSNLNQHFQPSTVEQIAQTLLEAFSTVATIQKVTVWEDQARWGSASAE